MIHNATVFNNLLMKKTSLYEMPFKRSLDIDTETDFKIVNFLISFFLTSRFILLYNTDEFIPSFSESMGTETLPSLVNSKSSFISSSSNLRNDRKESYLVINVDFGYIIRINFN